VRTRTLLAVGLLVTLLLAGVASFYASGSPDGLERVADEQGISQAEEDHLTGDGPLADYETRGVDDPRLSGGLAGVTGALVVLLLAGGLAYGVRRRDGSSRHPDDARLLAEPDRPAADRGR
jgi:cobalt/nickel transport system permease protein/cobalt/nickel transport protein